ncbi:MAG: hypothetical protein KatS3mg129_2162 [Leptospiraceae bacterium]|nr:MAG: hypothetical protein KatS3mg129_2162 [Leptospiraceae bacterium]
MISSIIFYDYEWQNIYLFLCGPLSLFILIYSIFEKNNKKKYFLFFLSAILTILFILTAKKTAKIQFSYYKNKLFLLEEIEKQIPIIIQKEKKPAILYFYADWCHSCKDLEERLTRKEIGELIQNGWIIIKIDVTNYDKYKDYLLENYGVYGIPALSFYDKEGKLIKPFTMIGAEIPLKTLISILRQFGVFERPI